MNSFGLTRAVKPALSRLLTPGSVTGYRFSSSESNSHEHAVIEDTISYPKEGFTSAAWGGVILFSAVVVAFYKYAPAPGEDNIITRSISHYYTPTEVWERTNLQHTLLSQEASENAQIMWHARKPMVHRYQYPQMIDQSLPHRQPVGSSVDLSELVVKGHKE